MAALLKQFDAFKARIKNDDYACDPDTKEALRLLGLLRCVDAGASDASDATLAETRCSVHLTRVAHAPGMTSSR